MADPALPSPRCFAPHRLRAIAALALLTLAACTSEAGNHQVPEAPDLPIGSWSEIEGGAGTMCADGSEFSFFVRPGMQNRLVVEFMGGGACWNAATCGAPFSSGAAQTFSTDRRTVTVRTLEDPSATAGLHDRARPANPVRDWHHVFVPYCTGDLHLGDATVTYEQGLAVHHRGARNARAALDWIERNYEAPERVFVTGCSAGAYASIFWTPRLRKAFPNATVAQLGDSGAGMITPSFAVEGLGRWNVRAALPQFVPGFDPALLERADVIEHLYRAVGQAYPEVPTAQYHTLADTVQISFYAEMRGVRPDGVAAEWTRRMMGSLDTLEAQVASFDAYVAAYGDHRGGTPHCIITRDDMYSVATSGTPFRDWLAALTRGERPGPVRPIVPLP